MWVTADDNSGSAGPQQRPGTGLAALVGDAPGDEQYDRHHPVYDFIIVGAGASGLSLAMHLVHALPGHSSILLIEKDAKQTNDRTWCFWTDRPTPYDHIAFRMWECVRFITPGVDRTLPLTPYRYVMLRGLDFYRHAYTWLARQPNVLLMRATVEHVQDSEDRSHGLVRVGGRWLAGKWVFDSRPCSYQQQCGQGHDNARCQWHHYLKQHFVGWEVRTPRPVFDPCCATLFDLRAPQKGGFSFFYVLPFSPQHALVEYTVFSPSELPKNEYEQALRSYLRYTVGTGEAGNSWEVLSEEAGVIAMTDRPFRRKLSKRVMAIGTPAGMVKPSSGYTFARIQRDSRAIARSLLVHGHPFDVRSGSPGRFGWYDRLMLEVMQNQPHEVRKVFTALFLNNPTARVLRFLDEDTTLPEEVVLLSRLPAKPFLKALLPVPLSLSPGRPVR